MPEPVHPPFLILGAGYVGGRLAELHPDAVRTRRAVEPGDRKSIRFDLADETTWPSLPVDGRCVVWTFPAVPLATVRRFYDARVRNRAHSVIVLGSTSAYRVEEGPAAALPPVVTEDRPLDPAQPRVEGEEWLREQGAVVLQLAGIFGPDRQPLDWVRRGRIRNGNKRVNLIHVDDILAVLESVAGRIGSPDVPRGLRINVANGAPAVWNDLVAAWKARGELPPDFTLPSAPAGPESKIVDARRLQRLMPGFPFRQAVAP